MILNYLAYGVQAKRTALVRPLRAGYPSSQRQLRSAKADHVEYLRLFFQTTHSIERSRQFRRCDEAEASGEQGQVHCLWQAPPDLQDEQMPREPRLCQ
jgi:hypothetical protein